MKAATTLVAMMQLTMTGMVTDSNGPGKDGGGGDGDDNTIMLA